VKLPRGVPDLWRLAGAGQGPGRLAEIVRDPARLEDALPAPVRRAELEARSLAVLIRAGALGGGTPQQTVEGLRALKSYGAFGAAPRTAALRHGELPGIADELGVISFSGFEEQINRLASAMRAMGLTEGSSVGVLCRNSRMPLIVAFAASRLGMNGIWLNTAFSPRQASEVAQREGIEFLIYDEELAEAAADINPRYGRLKTATEDRMADELAQLIARGDPTPPPAPPRPGRIVLLTSGTTGTPKGAPRPDARSLTIPGAVLDRMPMRAREVTVVAPPLFHGTGLLIALLTISLGSELVLRRHFDAAQFLDDIEQHRATAACVVPVMLQRVLALGEDEIRKRDLSSLKIVFSAGSQLPAEVAARIMDLLGDVVYNLYGSTEVAWATIADPADLRAAPGTAGRPPRGTTVKLLGEDGKEVPPGSSGVIYVGSELLFEGYTSGADKARFGALMSTGDVGHFDPAGRLFIDGRDDDMIVSGGENVYPGEVEEVLDGIPGVRDAAVVGVTDDEWGERLRAYVELENGASLSEQALKDHVKGRLAGFKVPRDVVFVDELPRNATGKVLKRELRARS
jgi:fatty-acyl-CoA synthase